MAASHRKLTENHIVVTYEKAEILEVRNNFKIRKIFVLGSFCRDYCHFIVDIITIQKSWLNQWEINIATEVSANPAELFDFSRDDELFSNFDEPEEEKRKANRS